MNASQSHRAHGYARYRLDGCRCYTCARAVSEYEARRRRLIAYGQWQPYVDAEPVRAHVRILMSAGIGRRTIARASGVPEGTLKKLLYGRRTADRAPSRRVRQEAARRILRLTPSVELLAAGTPVDATGTTRRLQALIAVGWTQTALAARLGWTVANFHRLLQQTRVTAGTARAVRALYDDLWNVPATGDGQVGRQAAARDRNTARRNDWPPPMAWDDDSIDDPDARPDSGEPACRRAAIAENAAELIAQGFTREQAADRLRTTRNAVDQALREEETA